MGLVNCPTCGHSVATSATSCPSCGAKLKPTLDPAERQATNTGCLGLVATAVVLFVAIPWGCSKLNPPPRSPEEALARAGYTEVERALSQMDCRDGEWKALPFSAFRSGQYVMGVVCKSKSGGYRIQSRAWNEDADGEWSLRKPKR